VSRLAISCALAGAIAAGADAWVNARLVELVLIQTAARATDQVQLGIVGRVGAQDFAPPHTPEALARSGERLSQLVTSVRRADSTIIGVDVLSADGTFIASDIPSWPGRHVPRNEVPLAEALDGHSGAYYNPLTSPEDWELRARSDGAFEVYVPIVLERDVVGAYVLYQAPSAVHTSRPEIIGLMAATIALVGMLARNLARRSVRRSSAKPLKESGTESEPFVLTASNREPDASSPLLTGRQLEVLRLLATQRTYRDIATELVVSEETVRTHVKHILRKLRQPTRTQAVVAALQLGLLDLP
jgi:DNA-binding CsgD family transcriptional regulator